MTTIDTTLWERSSDENWTSPSPTSLKMLKNLNHDYIVSNTNYSNYAISSDVTVLGSDDDGVGIVFDYLDSNNYKYIMYQGGGLPSVLGSNNPAIALFEVADGTHKKLKENETFSFWQKSSTFEIKLENIFDDIVFYVDGIEALRYKKENSVSGKIGFVTYSQICDFNNIQMYQTNANRIKAKYVLFAVGDNDTQTEINVKQYGISDTITEITPRALGIKSLDTEIFAMYRGNSDVLTEIQPIGYNNLATEIEVRPHNRMMAIWEVQQPPIVTEVFNPTQDAFTREKSDFATINYGGSSSMVAGNSTDDIWRSFIQFDLSSINPSYVLVDSKLRLYYKNAVPTHLNLELLNADSSWQEYNITNLNRPSPIKIITDEFELKNGYIEFDVLDIAKDWIALNIINNGFILRVSNETQSGQATFHTRESLLPPELVVSYFDSRIFSQGRSQIVTEMFVYNRGNSDLKTEVTVDSAYSFTTKDVEIYVHRQEVPIPNEVDTEIIVSKPYIPTIFTVTLHVDNDVLTEIGSRIGGEHKVNAEITITKPHIEAEVYVKHTNTIPVEISSRVLRESDTPTEITSNKPHIFAEVSARKPETNDILTEVTVSREVLLVEISVPQYGDSDILTEVDINSLFVSKVLTEILISKDSTKAEVAVRVGRLKDLYTEITVTRVAIDTEIYVKHRNDVLVEIEPNIKSDIMTEITSNRPHIEVELSVFGYENSDVYTEVFSSYINETHAEIDIRKISQVEVEIDIKKVSQLDTVITANKRKVYAEIVIPTWVDYDVPVTIEPRILTVNNIYTVIQIGSKGGAYAFII